jgi:multiple sugar transport system substrate-binding protein
MVHNCAMYYRTDLLTAAGFDAPPKNWDEYRQMAKATTKDGVWGTMILSKQGIEAATRLNAFYQQCGSDIIDANGKATIDTDAGHASLEFMTGMVFEDKAAPEGVLELPDMQGAWLDGKLALAPVWPYLYSLSKEPLGNTFAIGTAGGNPNPGGTVYSWGFAAAAGSKNPDAALEWVKWSTSTDQLYNFGKEWLNPVPRASAIDKISADPDIAESDKAAIAAFAASAAAGKSMPMVPQYSQLLDVLGIIQSGVMSKAMSIDDALKDGQMRAEAVMAG